VLRYRGLVEEYFELSGYIVECWLPLHRLYQRAQGFGCSVGLVCRQPVRVVGRND